VPEYCTCGAKLPEDARFCHKCGRPTREEPVVVEEAPLAPPPPAEPPPPQFPPIGFSNGPAVRVALLSGVVAFLLSVLTGQIVPAASILGLVAAGFLAVFLYQRRTGQRLSVIHGAHLGWISGIIGFAITTALLSAVVVMLSNPAVLDAMREQLKTRPGSQANIDQMLEVMRSPSNLLTGVAITFLLFTVFPACGGALGAKFLDRD